MAFKSHIKVCFGDIDNAGIVYYPRFLHYFHVALEDFFDQELGTDYPTLINDHGIGFPTVHLETDFRRPLRYGDHIDVHVEILTIGTTSVTWGYQARNRNSEQTIVVEGHNVTVCLNMDTFQKTKIPGWLVKILTQYQERTS
jgi:4-hydroxybenzoyl-CoA thioesterase